MSELRIVPCELADANAFVRAHHRHHPAVIGHKFSQAVVDANGEVRGTLGSETVTTRADADGQFRLTFAPREQ